MINIRWKNFDSILSQSKGRGYKNFPGGVPSDPQIFRLASLAFGLDCPSLHGCPPCPTIAPASLEIQLLRSDQESIEFPLFWSEETYFQMLYNKGLYEVEKALLNNIGKLSWYQQNN